MVPRRVHISLAKARLIELASKIALGSGHPHFHHGALLVKSGKVLNWSSNYPQFNSFAAKFFYPREHASLHAEIGCLLGMNRQSTEGADILVIRIKKQGQLGTSKPCGMCINAAKFCGIKRIFYSTDSGLEVLGLR